MFIILICPLVCGWKKILNFSLDPTFFMNNVQNYNIDFTSRSFTMTFGIPLCQTHMSKKSFAIPTTMVFVWVGANLTNFENLATTTKMASVPSHSRRHVIKSIETLLNGPKGIGRGIYNPNFLFMDLVFWHFTCADVLLYVFLHFGLIENFPQQLSCCLFTTMFHHGYIMHFLHDFCMQLSFWHIVLWSFPS